jgi:hypothetical protein
MALSVGHRLVAPLVMDVVKLRSVAQVLHLIYTVPKVAMSNNLPIGPRTQKGFGYQGVNLMAGLQPVFPELDERIAPWTHVLSHDATAPAPGSTVAIADNPI